MIVPRALIGSMAIVTLLAPPSLCSAASEPECGLEALYIAIISLSHDMEYAELKRQAPQLPADGYSLLELAQLAEAQSLNSKLVKTSYARLRARKAEESFACVAWLPEGHFVVIADIDELDATIVDPPTRYRTPLNVFDQLWDGDCLLISNQPLQDEQAFAESGRTRAVLLTCVGLGLTTVAALFIGRRRLNKYSG